MYCPLWLLWRVQRGARYETQGARYKVQATEGMPWGPDGKKKRGWAVKAYDGCKKLPFTIMCLVCLSWVGIGGSSLGFGFQRWEGIRSWSADASQQNCTIVGRYESGRCVDGPGAGGGGYSYVARTEGCQEKLLHTTPDCGEVSLAGKKRYTTQQDFAPISPDPANSSNVVLCWVHHDCSSFEFVTMLE
eukprot:Sspe_Gene.47726::Locus_24484_Transcript_1_1_Confidence_1.000_Length_718::g.47726::m.47726